METFKIQPVSSVHLSDPAGVRPYLGDLQSGGSKKTSFDDAGS